MDEEGENGGEVTDEERLYRTKRKGNHRSKKSNCVLCKKCQSGVRQQRKGRKRTFVLPLYTAVNISLPLSSNASRVEGKPYFSPFEAIQETRELYDERAVL
jgi:hypothetical protein